ncbi:MAG TPA: PHP domain-containing protein [Bryobacteraceae bacterium]|nr:PHP domain-containing protein [Bryobacteraceae bacterium]
MSEPAEQPFSRFIDLHSHTTASDGSLTPAELVALAKRSDLAALGITDHDTFGGYEEALSIARECGLDLVQGIELNSRLSLPGNSVPVYIHMLAYFPTRTPSPAFAAWLGGEREDRINRNRKLVEALRKRDVDISLEEVETRGRSLAGRAHFAAILVDKGYARNFEDAFRRFLGESAPSYVQRQSLTTPEVIRKIRDGGGIPSVAHPVRLRLGRDEEREVIFRLKDAGLLALEIYHSDHPPELQAHYRQLAEEMELIPTGGSDFHGRPKPNVALGTGLNGNVRVPFEFLERLREVRI